MIQHVGAGQSRCSWAAPLFKIRHSVFALSHSWPGLPPLRKLGILYLWLSKVTLRWYSEFCNRKPSRKVLKLIQKPFQKRLPNPTILSKSRQKSKNPPKMRSWWPWCGLGCVWGRVWGGLGEVLGVFFGGSRGALGSILAPQSRSKSGTIF